MTCSPADVHVCLLKFHAIPDIEPERLQFDFFFRADACKMRVVKHQHGRKSRDNVLWAVLESQQPYVTLKACPLLTRMRSDAVAGWTT